MTLTKKHFSKSISILLTVVLIMSAWGSVFAYKPDVTDTLDAALIGDTSGYQTITGIVTSSDSDARYNAHLSVSNGAIHLENGSGSGIVTHVSGGKAYELTVAWPHNKNMTIHVYGKHTEYSSPADLYNSETRGELIGSLSNKSGGNTLALNGYEYVGIYGEATLNSIQIVWNHGDAPSESYSVSFEANGGSGEMAPETEFGNFTVPHCGFTAPEGKEFIGWKSSYDGVVYDVDAIIELIGDLTLTAQWAAEELVSDTIDKDLTGINTGSSYAAWSGTVESGTVYAGKTAMSGDVILIDSGNGIYTTKSIGYAQTITVDWHGTSKKTSLEVYGKDTPYESVEDLYDENKCGSHIATIQHENESTISLTGAHHYKYIGIAVHSSKDAAHISSITIGWEKVQTVNEITDYTLVLDDGIFLRVYTKLDEETSASEDAYMRFVLPDGTTQDVLVKNAGRDGDYFYFQCGVSARLADSAILVSFFDGFSTGKEYSVSVAQYARTIIDLQNTNEAYRKAAPLAQALLNYCEASRVFFGVDGDPMNEGYEDSSIADISAATINKPFTDDPARPEGVTVAGATLSLKSKTSLSLYFSCPDDVQLSFNVEGKTFEPTEVDGYQVVRIRGIKPVELASEFTVTINGTYSMSYSPMNYCYNVLNNDSQSAELKDVVRALYNYYSKAAAYVS